MANARESSAPAGNQFGTFGGVFTPSILTIFGVIMFMRAGLVTGKAGILGALAILLLSKVITALTSVSISAISTNTPVGVGGAYFLISRTMGPEFGATIGLAMFLAQSLSVPFYILGFTEAVVRSHPGAADSFLLISLSMAAVLAVVTWSGAGWAIKLQYFILALMGLSILTFLGGSATHFDSAVFQSNLGPAADDQFWLVFAIYFPAVTGIMAGVNLSGDLANPSHSIPRGTFAALAVGLVVYALEILIVGGATSREMLIQHPYQVLLNNALFGAGFLVAAGVYCATLSSAIGSLMGAPRVLQALARDHLFPSLRFFGRGSGQGDEPRVALCLTTAITFAVLLLAGNSAEGGAFNFVAMIVTMFFLFTYGMTNLAAFLESYGRNPSFRPTFRLYHWSAALLGAIGCGAAAFLIDAFSALVASGAVLGLYFTARRRILGAAFGDARRGFVYSRVRQGLLNLRQMPVHPKNWRPTILVLSGNPASRRTLVMYSIWFESQRGILSLVELIVDSSENAPHRSEAALRRLQDFVEEHQVNAFPEVITVDDFDAGMSVFLQSHSIGPIKPNIVMLGWTAQPERSDAFVGILRMISEMGKSVLVVSDRGLPDRGTHRRIDLWWRGHANGSLMLILAYMLTLNDEWKMAKIRVLRQVGSEKGRAPAAEALQSLIEAARVEAQVEVIVSADPFPRVLRHESADAGTVFLGLALPEEASPAEFCERTDLLLEGMPSTILVLSSGEADLLA